jgi:hypothetical protein
MMINETKTAGGKKEMAARQHIVPVFTSDGEPGAFFVDPYLYNLQGEWIGWVTPVRDVYSTLGIYVGYLTNEPRILRKRSWDFNHPRQPVPKAPPNIYPLATIPLAPLMKEMTNAWIDILNERPEELHTNDAGELREDMD